MASSGVLLAAVLAACGGAPEDSRVQLRLKYTAGDTLVYEYEASGTITLPDTITGSGTIDKPYEQSMTIYEVASEITPRGNFLVTWIFLVNRDTLIEAGSDHPDHIKFDLELSPQGRIVDLFGVDTAQPLTGEIDFKSYFEQTQPVFPERPLGVGDSWTQEVKVISLQSEPVVTSSTYVLEELMERDGNAIAVIAYDGDVYLPVVFSEPSSETSATDGPRSMEQRIESRGRMHFSIDRGIVERVEGRVQAQIIRVGVRDGEPFRRNLELIEETMMRLVE